MKQPTVSLIKQPNYHADTLKDSIANMLKPLGGMEHFVKPGQNVILKLNLVRACAPGVPAHTQPEVFRAVAELALDCGGKVSAGDSPGMGTAVKVAQNAGILPIAQEIGVPVIEFTGREVFDEKRRFKKLRLAEQLLDADVVINLPRLKTHGQMMLTAAVKNMFGAVIGAEKYEWHYRAGENKDAFARMLYEISDTIHPALHILDAVVSMDGIGPTSGKANPTGFMAAGTDPVAIDATMMHILDRDPKRLPVILAATEAGDTHWQSARICGELISNLRPRMWHWPPSSSLGLIDAPIFQKHPKLKKIFRKMSAIYPFAIKGKCVRCGACAKVCPAQAITVGETVEIDYDKCIRCYCCHELCPHDAMDMRGGVFARILKFIGKRL